MLLENKNSINLNILKYIAVITMLIDHVALAFVDDSKIIYVIMRMIGRTAAPIMFFAAVEGYHHTQNLKKYLTRLLIFALVSYLPFIFAFNNQFNSLKLNVIFTILLGVLAIYVRREIKSFPLKILAILIIILASTYADYSYIGVLIILLFDLQYGNRQMQLFNYFLVVLFGFGLFQFITRPLIGLFLNQTLDFSYFWSDIFSLGYLVPLVLLKFYNGKLGIKNSFSKWFFYVFYPMHLAVIGIVRFILVEN